MLPIESRKDMRDSAEMRMQNRQIFVQEADMYVGALLDIAEFQLAHAEDLWETAPNDVLGLIDVYWATRQAAGFFDSAMTMRVSRWPEATEGKQKAERLQQRAKEALERWYGKDALVMLEVSIS